MTYVPSSGIKSGYGDSVADFEVDKCQKQHRQEARGEEGVE